MLQFIFSKKFILQAGLALLFVVLTLFGTYFFLKSFTRPKAVVSVPGVVGFDIVEAEATMKNAKLEPVIIDSIFLKGKKGGEIVMQDPIENASVKEGRKIYLTITRFSSPMVKLPNTINQGLPAAMARLASYGFDLYSDFEYKPADCSDCVIGIMYRGKSIQPGTRLPEGAKLKLVVGMIGSGELIETPILFGLDTAEAIIRLRELGLNLGATPCADCATKEDSARAVIYRQIPDPFDNNTIMVGSTVDVFLTSDSTQVPIVETDSLSKSLD